jgi:hypothetical protein
VHVRVDEARHEVAPAAVDAPPPGARREARDPAAGHADIDLQPLAREGREDARALDHEVRRALAAGDGEQVGEVVWHHAMMAAARPRVEPRAARLGPPVPSGRSAPRAPSAS